MKKLLFASLAALALSVVGSAATIGASCTVIPVTFTSGNGGPVNVTCVSFNSLGTGGTLTSGLLQFVGDMVLDSSFNPPPADQATLTFNPNQGFTTQTVVVSNAQGSFLKANNSPQSTNSAAINGANTVIVAVSSVGTGAALTSPSGSSNGSVFLTYTYTPQTTGTPEPATMSMLGFGLLGLGYFAKKFRK